MVIATLPLIARIILRSIAHDIKNIAHDDERR